MSDKTTQFIKHGLAGLFLAAALSAHAGDWTPDVPSDRQTISAPDNALQYVHDDPEKEAYRTGMWQGAGFTAASLILAIWWLKNYSSRKKSNVEIYEHGEGWKGGGAVLQAWNAATETSLSSGRFQTAFASPVKPFQASLTDPRALLFERYLASQIITPLEQDFSDVLDAFSQPVYSLPRDREQALKIFMGQDHRKRLIVGLYACRGAPDTDSRLYAWGRDMAAQAMKHLFTKNAPDCHDFQRYADDYLANDLGLQAIVQVAAYVATESWESRGRRLLHLRFGS